MAFHESALACRSEGLGEKMSWRNLWMKRLDTRADTAGTDEKYGEPQLTSTGDLRVRDDDACTYLAMLAGALTITLGAEDGSDGIKVSVQGGAWRQKMRVWLSATAYGAVSAVTSEVINTGTELQEIVNHGDYEVMSDAAGLVEVTFTVAGAATRYLMAEVAGRTYASTLITWAA
jgi:hypothetical protein